MMKVAFRKEGGPLLMVMVQADHPGRIKELMDKSIPEGAEGFGIQLERLKRRYRTKGVCRDLFACAKGKPVYVTNYRIAENRGKSDDLLAEELLEAAECGADLCDVMGDCFDAQPGEMTYRGCAVDRQKKLIDRLHKKGACVLMSSHIYRFTPADQILEIALEQQNRGADICKIVVGAGNMEQQLENLNIVRMLRETLDIPFLFLSTGECRILRSIGWVIGCSMCLCVYEHDAFATPQQPLLRDIRQIRDAYMR